MSFLSTPEWGIEVSSQGEHSTDVDLNGVTRFIKLVAVKQLAEFLNAASSHYVNYRMVCESFFSRGNWKLNMERKQLLGSNHYRAGTFRVYEETDFNGLRVVVHLPSGERRYGHLHPPKAMTTSETREAFKALRRCFTDPKLMELEETYEDTYHGFQKVDTNTQRFRELKQEAQPWMRAYDHTRAIFRSKEKKFAFIEHLSKVTEKGRHPIFEQVFDHLLRNHWNKYRGDSKISYNDHVELLLVAQVLAMGLVIDGVSGDQRFYRLGEYGEILLNEYLSELERKRLSQLEQELAATKKLVDTLAKRETNLIADLEKTRTDLELARQKLVTLQAQN